MAIILVVDDEPDSLQMIATMIRVELGCSVIKAASAEEALEKAHRADTILTDVVMPGTDGFQLCRALKSREDTKDIPIIMMTSYLGDIADKLRGLELGAIDYLMKPLKKDELISRLKIMLRVKDAEERLKQARLHPDEQLYLLLAALQKTTEGITVTDREGKWIFVNQAEADIFGYTIKSFLRKSANEFYDQESIARINTEAIPTLKTIGLWSGELRGKKKNGELFPLILNLTSISDEHNKFLGIMGITRDIGEIKKAQDNLINRSRELLALNQKLHDAYTDLKDAQRALIQAERLKMAGEIAGGLAHDIKNLLAGLKGGIDIVDHCLNLRDLNKLEEGWGMLKRGHHRVIEMVEDLLYCSRKSGPTPRLADISKIIREEVSLLKPRMKSRGISLKLNLPSNIPKFYFDPKSIRRCISNLVTNSIEALENKKEPQITIAISCQPETRKIKISVSDKGRGITEAEQDKIFEILYTTKQKGIGLGLAIVKKAVSDHGGTIEVGSKKNMGSKFTITLPFRRRR